VSGKRAALLAVAMAVEGFARLEELGVPAYCQPSYVEMTALMWPKAVRVVEARRMGKRAARKKKSARQIEMRLCLRRCAAPIRSRRALWVRSAR
jgi:hypothetical protein